MDGCIHVVGFPFVPSGHLASLLPQTRLHAISSEHHLVKGVRTLSLHGKIFIHFSTILPKAMFMS